MDDALRLGTRQVDLIDDREHIQIVIQRQIDIGQSLCFDALRRVYDQDRTITGSQATGNFIVEVHMSGRIDQIEDIFIAVICLIDDAAGLRLDRDTSLALQFHIIQDLRLHFALCKQARLFDDAVGQCRLTMIDVGDDTKVSYELLIDRHKYSVRFYNSGMACDTDLYLP